MTLMPVSNCSVLGERSSKLGGSRWIGQRSVVTDRSSAVDRVAEQIEDASQRLLADRHAHRAAGVDDGHAPDQAVGRAQRHAPDAIAAQMLLDLAGQADVHALVLGRDRQGVVDVGEVALVELGVERRADHLGDSSICSVAVAMLRESLVVGCLGRTTLG